MAKTPPRKGTDKSGLADPEQVAKDVAEITGQPLAGSDYLEAAKIGEQRLKKANRRKDYQSNKGRRRYNTMMHPELKDLLTKIAAGKDITVPDLIEEIICKQLGIKPPSDD